MGMTDRERMAEAYALALQAQSEGEVPVGAVLFSEDGQCLGRGYNQVIQRHDPTAHAEIVAIREAARRIQNYRLQNTILYVTLEPCGMCATALVHARIQRLVFAARDVQAGAAGSVLNLLNHRVIVDEGVLQKECSLLLTNFFKSRR